MIIPRNKHLIITGETSEKRHTFIKNYLLKANKEEYHLEPNLKTFDDYLDSVRKVFPFVPAGWHEPNTKKWNYNQIWDFHLDWTEGSKEIIIVLEEFGEMEKDWRVEILRNYIQVSYWQEEKGKDWVNFQLVSSISNVGNLINLLEDRIGLGENEKRSPAQVLQGKLEIINLESSVIASALN